jgi:hypothetical protein
MSYLIAAVISILVFSGGLSSFMQNPPKWFSKSIRQFAGFGLAAFTAVLLIKARYEIAVPVGMAAIIMLGLFDKLKPNFNGGSPFGRKNANGNADAGTNLNLGTITEQEAHEILGIAVGTSEDGIKSAHRLLITKLHPDTGGNAWLAARVNLARDILLKKSHL